MAVEFTVGIPTHNRRETVLLALVSALEQTRPPARVYVIADGCTDGTQEAVRELGDERVEVLDRPKGPGCGYGHRNEVLELAGDGLVAWLGDDDLWLPDHLERAGELLAVEETAIVNSMACLVDEDGGLEPFGVHWRAPTYRDRFLGIENRTPSSAVSHRARPALAAGGWPTDMDRAGDWDLWQRMVRDGAHPEMVMSPTVLFFSAAGREQSWSDRVAQNAGFLARMRDPSQLARLRGEMALTCMSRQHGLEVALAHSEERDDVRKRELDTAKSERDDLAAQIHAITTGTWWRLRRPLEPLIRLRKRLRGRA